FDPPKGFGPPTIVHDEATWLGNWHNRRATMVVFEGVTDASGHLTLAGPGERPLGLRVLGPGHVLLQQTGVRLDVERELVVTVHGGARLVGNVVPLEAMAELRRLMVWQPAQVPATFPAGNRPTLRLQGEDGRSVPATWSASETAGAPLMAIDDDGRFAIEGLPAGRWTLQVEYQHAHGKGVSTRQRLAVATIVLQEGLEARVEVDLSSLLPGELIGEVLHNGQPLARGDVLLLARYAAGLDGARESGSISLQTDGEGRFTHRGRPGDYTLVIPRWMDNPPMPYLGCDSSATVVRGQATRHTFVITSGELLVRVLDAAGRAVPGVKVDANGASLPPTAIDGSVRVKLTAGVAVLRTLPKSLHSSEAQRKMQRESGASGQTDPLLPYRIELGTVTVIASQTTTLELRLPVNWDK
ncbi:MAG: Ig-like domain-containing protein, partial [Planctomycetota bacterium]